MQTSKDKDGYFDLRRSVYDLPADQLRMVDVARRHGSHAEFAGSGGSPRGVARLELMAASMGATHARF